MAAADRDTADRAGEGRADSTTDPDSGSQLEPPAAPRLLDSIEEQRKRELIRARLFGEPPEPLRIGRFVPVRRLGAGGMGVVYIAYDEQLDRKVAVKLLRSDGTEAHGRLLREAQALAKLAHPNIVNIYEVGVSEDRVFIAMEFVAGKTLREWLKEKPRTLHEVLAAFEQAGRGLIAVHKQGLVHRDFKPDNVMVGDDGRVRIVDFGLARWIPREPGEAGGAAATDAPSAPASGAISAGAAPPAHSTGGIDGTPLYMPPEQFVRGSLDARSDQFSFCAALFEGLYGEAPFAGRTLTELAENKSAGAIRELEDRLGVPDWLRQLVLRGLRPNPDERWPSMEALLPELTRDRKKWRRRALYAVGLALLAAVSMGLGRWLQSAERSACTGGRPQIAEVWGEAQRSAVQKALLSSGVSYASATLSRVQAQLDRYADAWAAMHGEACQAYRRGEQSAELLDLRMACLERRRAGLRATVQVLTEGAPVEQAIEVAGGLTPLADCADAVALRGAGKPPADPAVAKQVAQLREQNQRAEAEERAGRYERGLAEAHRIVETAQTLGYEPLLAESLFVRASLESRLGRYQDAATTLEAVYVRALANHLDELAAEAANLSLYVIGYRQARFDAVRTWEQVAEALVLRLPDARRLAVDFYSNRGQIRVHQGRYEQASADIQRALGLSEQVFGSHHLKFARVLNNASQISMAQRDYAATLRYQQQALAIREENLGPEHPVVAVSLTNLGSTLKSLGRLDEASAALRRALSIEERAVGVGHPDTAQALRNLADVELRQGKYDEARASLRRAEQGLAGTQPGVQLRHAAVFASFSALDERQGNAVASAAYAQKAVEIYQALLPADHLELANGLSLLGSALLRIDNAPGAAPHCQRALTILESKLGASHPLLAPPLVCLARVALTQKDAAAALTALERAAALLVKEPAAAEYGECHFLLAQRLAARGELADNERIVALASRAIRDFEGAGPAYKKDADAVRSFLTAQRR